MMVSLSLVASTLGLLLASVFRSEQALIATTVLVSMALAAMSGAWFPLEITGATFQSVGHLLPTAWILDGLRGIVVRGFGAADVLPALWVSLAWAAGFFLVAVWRFRLSD
jgi:ABC-2 type transport system permease protein